MIKQIALAGSIITLTSMAYSPANAAMDEPWMVRVRAVHIDMANQSSPVPALGVNASDTVHVSNKTIPEIDISYFFTPSWAAELVLTYPQRHLG